MKRIIFTLIIMLLIINCQKDKVSDEYSPLDDKTNDISQNIDSIKTEDQTVNDIQPEPEQVLKDSDQQSLEKLPKIKPTEYSTPMTKAELWEKYNNSRQEVNLYKENWDFEKLINSLNQTAEISQKLQRPDIASWQFNNIGYYSIVEFKRRTDYNNRFKDIEAMPYGQEKIQFINETKEIFRREMDLLTSAQESLYDAIEIDNLAPDKERQKIINSNINYINSVKNFIKE